MDSAMHDPSSSTTGERLKLSDLLQQSRRLNAHLGTRVDLPTIQLGLDQIEAQSRKIAQARAPQFAAGGARGGNRSDVDTKAHYFLANGGIDASGLADTITQTNIANAFEPLQPIFDTDVDSYLRHSHEQIILSAIEESRKETLADFHRNLSKVQTRDWETQKVRILEELGQHHYSNSGRESFRQSINENGLRSSRSFTPARSEMLQIQGAGGVTTTGVGSRGAKYQAVIEKLNVHRLDSAPYAIATALGDAIKGVQYAGEGNSVQELHECWKALASLVGEIDVVDGEFQGAAVRARQYAPAYLGPESGSSGAWLGREGHEMRKTLVSGGLKFLGLYFHQQIEAKIASNPIKAQLGGRPTAVGKVIAFERVAFADRDGKWPTELEVIQTEHGQAPLWATLMYLLCTGDSQAALDFVNQHDDAIRDLETSSGTSTGFSTYFQTWLKSEDRSLPKQMRDRLVAEYNTRFRGMFAADAVDAYKMTLYRLVGRVDVNKAFPAAISSDTELWLWTHLSLVRESLQPGNSTSEYGDALRDRLTLQDLGARVVKTGERNAEGKTLKPLQHFTQLLLCGQFERAVAYLFARPQYQVDAVHFASALTYYGLLRIPSQSKISHVDVLSSSVDQHTGQEIVLLDYAKIIQKYVRLFSRNDVKAALQYIYLICINGDCASPIGEEQTAKCHDLLRALVVETRQYFDLLGDVRNDGTKTPGLIEQSLSLIGLSDSKEFLTNIVGAAAAQSEADGRTRDAILLYNIAEEYDRVLDVINRQMGLTLIEPTSNATTAIGTANGADASLTSLQDTADLARAILDSYERQSHILRSLSRNRIETCRILLSLKQSFTLFGRGEYEQALNLADSLDLIPLRGDVVTITRKAEAFKDVDDTIARNLSEILLMLMNAISKIYQACKSSAYGDSGRQQRLSEYRGKARALMLFAGMLRLRIEPSTFAQLTRLDVYLH
jgi:nuclear pore complex protein Nup93